MGSNRRRSGRAALVTAAALLSLALGASCARPKSYFVLKLESGTPIAGVTSVNVDVHQSDTLMANLTYPAAGLTIGDSTTNDLSVSFSGGQSGAVTFVVKVYAGTCEVGESAPTNGVIKGGNVGQIVVVLSPVGSCNVQDGGADAPPGRIFPGCDPVPPTCAVGKTCQVNCDKGVGECTAGGKGAPGAPCAMNADCAPGSQCFDYAGTGCGVKVCLRFCNNDNGCATGDAGVAVGTRSLCVGSVQCGGVNTGYHTCTFGCDPREPAATADTTGCPKGLACLVVADVIGDVDQVDCTCAEKTRLGKDNAPCTSSALCAPGYICMTNQNVCRAICRCDSNGTICTAPNDCSTSGKTCSVLANKKIFGVCL